MLAANKTRRSDNAEYQVFCKAPKVPFAFSFPLCDLLICEFNPEDAVFSPENVCSEFVTKANVYKPLHGLGVYVGRRSPKSPAAGSPLSALAELIYQKVIRRKPVPFLQSKKDLTVGCYIVETLACGHTVEVHPSEIETLTARKRSCHECSGWFGGLQLKKPVQKVIGEARRKIKQSGFSPWPVTVFATCLIVAGALWLHARWPTTYIYQAPDYSVRVLYKYTDYAFKVQLVEHGVAQAPAIMRFCHDYAPQFEPGHTLTRLAFDDHGKCVSVAPENRGYSLLRDAEACPIVPANCWHTDCADSMTDHVVCTGKPDFD